MEPLTQTLTVAEVKQGTVTQDEINSIIRGEDLIEVNNEDLENLFGIKALRRKIMLTMTPAFHDSNLTNRFIGAVIFALGSVALGTLTSANVALTIEITGWIACTIMTIVTGFLIFNDSSDNVKDTLIFTGGMAIGATLSGVVAYYAGTIIPEPLFLTEESAPAIWWSIALAITVSSFGGMAIYLYRQFSSFAKNAVELYYDVSYINDTEQRQKMLNGWADSMIRCGNMIPDAVRYNLLAHGVDSKYTRVEFVKPVLDLRKYSNEKKRQRLARDPAVVLRDSAGVCFLVGAWDIKGDAEHIIAEAKKQTTDVVRSVSKRLSSASKRNLLNTIKKNMTKAQ